MSNRRLNAAPKSPGINDTRLLFVFLPQGVGVPLMSEGDPAGSYASVTRTGVGVYVIKTADSYVALKNWDASFLNNAPGNWSAQWGPITKNADNTFSLTITALLAGVATEIAAHVNNRVSVDLVFRNSITTP